MPLDRLFPAQEKDERVLFVIRRHWFTYAIFCFVGLIMLVPVVIFLIYWLNNTEAISESAAAAIVIFGSIYLLFILGIMIYGFIDYYLDVYIVTDRRIVDIAQNGLFKRDISELNMHQVQDVNAEVNGFFPTLLHFGDVYIQTAGERPNFTFSSIPHPYEVSKQIIDFHEKYAQHLEAISESDSKSEDCKFPGQEDFTKYNNCLAKHESKKILKGIEKTKKEISARKEGQLKEGQKIDL